MAIRFSTSGRRATIAGESTFAHVGRATKAICKHPKSTEILVGTELIADYDARFSGEFFSRASHLVDPIAAKRPHSLLRRIRKQK